MRFKGVDSSQYITVAPSVWALPKKRIYVSTFGCHLTPDEARRVAKALVREAEKAEKKGRKNG
jgi:hypothetical protein